jgi:hypothetical protein
MPLGGLDSKWLVYGGKAPEYSTNIPKAPRHKMRDSLEIIVSPIVLVGDAKKEVIISKNKRIFVKACIPGLTHELHELVNGSV